MWVQALSLTDYRSYPQVDIEFTPGVSTLVGMNGQGKTNLVEAIAYLATLGSHRVSTDAPLVRQEAEHAVIRARVREEERSVSLDLQVNPGGSNKARINRSPATKAADILGIVRSVLFAPEDLSLVRGDPADRRRFLDDMSVQRHPRMLGVKADYDRVLRQRNALLKSAAGRPSASMTHTLEVWDDQLVELGADIIRTVHNSFTISPTSRSCTSRSRRSHRGCSIPAVVTTSTTNTQRCLPERRVRPTRATRRRVPTRITLVGPHRDDVDLVLDGLPVKGTHRTVNRGPWPYRCGWRRRRFSAATTWT